MQPGLRAADRAVRSLQHCLRRAAARKSSGRQPDSTYPGAGRSLNTRALPAVVYTIGHSTRPSEAFVALLQAHGVRHLVDVRTIPRSRHNPQYNSDALAATLAAAGIGYTHMKSLGGLRRPKPDSINAGWRNESFRGYADYMQTPEFAAAITELLALGAEQPTAIMCAEAVPWRCHRSLVADALVARGVEADEIVSESKVTPHTLTSFARVEGTTVTYPPEGSLS